VARQGHIPGRLTAAIRIGSRTETIRPHRVVFADAAQEVPALLVMADTSPHVGRGRGRTAYARFVELLRATGRRLGLLTNGSQFRLISPGWISSPGANGTPTAGSPMPKGPRN